MPPHIAVGKALAKVSNRYRDARERKMDTTFSTYKPIGFTKGWKLAPREMDLAKALTLVPVSSVHERTNRILAHEFNLLGSGWVKVRHGVECAGLEGSSFKAGEKASADSEGRWLIPRINEKNIPESRRIWGLIEQNYEPIDWQLDFKSGYRWRENALSRDITYGELRGQDVKVPWELARMQHLPTLAWAFGFAVQKTKVFEAPEIYLNEFRNQILDFIATNPPRYGVNWSCTMDVGIRVANWVLAYDLFRSLGAKFDSEFEETFSKSIFEHADHIYHHLEWDPLLRSNHYLADIAGLLWAVWPMAGFGRSVQARCWGKFAGKEFDKEIFSQFHAEGSNFEGSTSYHRLSAEMIAYTTALRLGGGEGKVQPRMKLSRDYLKRLEGMALFTLNLTKPDGNVVQMGDNDSGRFFKLLPVEDNTLDHRHLLGAFNGLFHRKEWAEAAQGFEAETELIRQLTGGAEIKLNEPESKDSPRISYPDFGLYRMTQGPWWLCVRCGPVGQKGNGGHAHNDQLSFELCVDGRSCLVDPGTFVYTPLPEERNKFRSSAMHNTLSLNGQEQNPFGPELFRLKDKAQAKVMDFREGHFVGEHKGFGAAHRRTLKLDESGLKGLDECAGEGTKFIYFHAAPGWEAGVEDPHHAHLTGGTKKIKLESADGEWLAQESNYSGEYGKKETSRVLILKSNADKIAWKIWAGEK